MNYAFCNASPESVQTNRLCFSRNSLDDNDVTPSTLNEFDEQERSIRLHHDEPTLPQDDDVILQQALRARHLQNNDLSADTLNAGDAPLEAVQLSEGSRRSSSAAMPPAIPPKPAHLSNGATSLNIPASSSNVQDAFDNKGFEVEATEI